MHEQSITFQLRDGPHKGKWVNTPGVYNGKSINEDLAHELLFTGKLPPLGGPYPTVTDAVMAAQIRSMLFNPDETGHYDKIQPTFPDLIRGTVR